MKTTFPIYSCNSAFFTVYCPYTTPYTIYNNDIEEEVPMRFDIKKENLTEDNEAADSETNGTDDEVPARLTVKDLISSFLSRILPLFYIDRLLARLATSYFLVLALSMFFTEIGIDTLAYQQSVNLVSMIARIAIIFILLTVAAPTLGEKVDFSLFAVSLFILAWVISYRYRNYFVILGVSVAFTVFFLYALSRGKHRFSIPSLSERARKNYAAAAVVLLFLIPTVVISLITCVRYLNFSSPNFDFGVFVNMFHNMRVTGLPMTTNERNGLLSHFAVHLSPVYYLILPFYIVFPSPLTLQIAQAVALGSSVFPMYLICRQKKLSRLTSLFFCAVVAFFPGMVGGTFYDLHENCFLMPLLLWTFYFFERGKFLPVLVFSLLVCMVKEDAPVYIVFFAIYAFMAKSSSEQRMRRLKAVIYAGFALIYFYFALKYLQARGIGIMDWRYGQYAAPDDGLVGVLKGILINPSLVFYNVFADNTLEKLLFMIQLLLPLLFLPFFTKKPARLILICPMLLVNLMPTWRYQYNIGFQYQFGSGAFLIYAALLNFTDMFQRNGTGAESLPAEQPAEDPERPCVIQSADDLECRCAEQSELDIEVSLIEQPAEDPESLPPEQPEEHPEPSLPRQKEDRNTLYPQALALCMLCVTLFIYSALVYNSYLAVRNFGNGKEMRTILNAALEVIPSGASVTASTMLVPHLADREIIYEFFDGTNSLEYNIKIIDDIPMLKQETEYIVIDLRGSGFSAEMFEYFSSSEDWDVITAVDGYIAVLKNIRGYF